MLVICEDCAKKYNIDESRIKGNRARFSCSECGHIIIVNKSDVTRPIVSTGEQQSSGSTSTIDLLRDLEAPISPETDEISSGQVAGGEVASQTQRKKIKRKNRGLPIIVYFIISMLFALICVSLVTGYLYTEYLYTQFLADIYNESFGSRQDVMFEFALIFGAAWMVILIFVMTLGTIVHKKFKALIKNANQLSSGQYDIEIVKKGSREVRDLAFALERIRTRLKGDR